uniref:Uncharacterized protein n=1 Tax=Brassica oleracea var. oleracea TaxID=109376 RepID=A0A0D3BWQ6_BRAOL
MIHVYASCGVWELVVSSGWSFNVDKKKRGRLLALELKSSLKQLQKNSYWIDQFIRMSTGDHWKLTASSKFSRGAKHNEKKKGKMKQSEVDGDDYDADKHNEKKKGKMKQDELPTPINQFGVLDALIRCAFGVLEQSV